MPIVLSDKLPNSAATPVRHNPAPLMKNNGVEPFVWNNIVTPNEKQNQVNKDLYNPFNLYQLSEMDGNIPNLIRMKET